MSSLPSEIKEEILTALVNDYDDYPAFQWSQLRSLSSVQRRRIDKYFELFWLPKLKISAYINITYTWEYTFECTDEQSGDGTAIFRHKPDSTDDPEGSRDMRQRTRWWTLPNNKSTVILRFDKQFLNKRQRGRAIVSDADIQGLEVSDDGLTLRLNWRDTFTALFREIYSMEIHRAAALKHAMKDYDKSSDDAAKLQTREQYLLKCLVLDIQMPSRVAVIRHRHARAHTIPVFHQVSMRLHQQTPNEKSSVRSFDDEKGPDIYEVANQEESMISYLPGWDAMDDQTLLEIYSDELCWRDCICLDRRNDLSYYEGERKARSNMSREFLKQHMRYFYYG